MKDMFSKPIDRLIAKQDFNDKFENLERASFVETVDFQLAKIHRAESLIANIADYILNQGDNSDPIQCEISISVQNYFRTEVEVAKSRLAKIQNAKH